jgi:hypothetical protein
MAPGTGRCAAGPCRSWVKNRRRSAYFTCPLFSRKQTLTGTHRMSALGHKRTHPLQQKLTYSITSSAAVSSLLDTVSPSILAVSALMISSNFVD